jgi:hypothetical protein
MERGMKERMMDGKDRGRDIRRNERRERMEGKNGEKEQRERMEIG